MRGLSKLFITLVIGVSLAAVAACSFEKDVGTSVEEEAAQPAAAQPAAAQPAAAPAEAPAE